MNTIEMKTPRFRFDVPPELMGGKEGGWVEFEELSLAESQLYEGCRWAMDIGLPAGAKVTSALVSWIQEKLLTLGG